MGFLSYRHFFLGGTGILGCTNPICGRLPNTFRKDSVSCKLGNDGIMLRMLKFKGVGTVGRKDITLPTSGRTIDFEKKADAEPELPPRPDMAELGPNCCAATGTASAAAMIRLANKT